MILRNPSPVEVTPSILRLLLIPSIMNLEIRQISCGNLQKNPCLTSSDCLRVQHLVFCPFILLISVRIVLFTETFGTVLCDTLGVIKVYYFLQEYPVGPANKHNLPTRQCRALCQLHALCHVYAYVRSRLECWKFVACSNYTCGDLLKQVLVLKSAKLKLLVGRFPRTLSLVIKNMTIV